MTTEPTDKHQQDARQIVRECLAPGQPAEQSVLIQRITAALSSRDREIREVLEGLRYRHGCWCELPPNITSPDHTCECDAARALWNCVNLTEPAK